MLFVQIHNVYPQLLLARLFFSIGGAAVSTMVTAVLPTMSYESNFLPVPSNEAQPGGRRQPAPSGASDITITPARYQSNAQNGNAVASESKEPALASSKSSARVSGFVGMFTGCGALIALTVFLPLPAIFQKSGKSSGYSLQLSYYIVAVVAFVVAICCLVGLQSLKSEQSKSITSLFKTQQNLSSTTHNNINGSHSLRNLYTALALGAERKEIGLGYLGGFVARASSVGISLFVPLLINAAFLSSGLCQEAPADTPAGLPDIKRQCPRAYIVAAQMTGISQLVALLTAPIFGYATARYKQYPLITATIAGMAGYPLFANHFDPDATHISQRVVAFVSVCLIGISQIGAIVCSLASLSQGVLSAETSPGAAKRLSPPGEQNDISNRNSNLDDIEESDPLLPEAGHHDPHTGALAAATGTHITPSNLAELKGSIAGVYSFFGGGAILILTKAGGALFDKVSTAGPFYIMAGFNACLFLACVFVQLRDLARSGAKSRSSLH